MGPTYISPIEWRHAMDFARQACARVFRDGGSPTDALRAFGLPVRRGEAARWDKAVDRIAQSLCAAPLRQAA